MKIIILLLLSLLVFGIFYFNPIYTQEDKKKLEIGKGQIIPAQENSIDGKLINGSNDNHNAVNGMIGNNSSPRYISVHAVQPGPAELKAIKNAEFVDPMRALKNLGSQKKEIFTEYSKSNLEKGFGRHPHGGGHGNHFIPNPNYGYYGRDGQGRPVVPVVLTDDSFRHFPGVTFLTTMVTQTLTFVTPTSFVQLVTTTGQTTVPVTQNITSTILTSPNPANRSVLSFGLVVTLAAVIGLVSF